MYTLYLGCIKFVAEEPGVGALVLSTVASAFNTKKLLQTLAAGVLLEKKKHFKVQYNIIIIMYAQQLFI